MDWCRVLYEGFGNCLFFYIQESFTRILFKVFNKTDKIFVLEIVKKSLTFISIVIGLYYKSIEVLMYGFMITYTISYFINYFVSRTVYLSVTSVLELNYVLKVTLTLGLMIGGFYLVQSFLGIPALYSLILAPFIILLYVFILTQIKVLNIKEDLTIIRNLRKR